MTERPLVIGPKAVVPLGVVASVLLAVGLSVMGWAVMTIIDHDTRIVRVEASRYTAADAKAEAQLAAKERFLITERLTRAETAIAAERADTMATLRDVLRRLDRIEGKVDAIQTGKEPR